MNITIYIKIDLYLFLILHLIKFTFLDCIDNIINLGGKNFKYSHFSFNSEGDMIIDTHEYPLVSYEIRFFGLRANGNFYFFDSNKNETPYYSFLISFHINYINNSLILTKNLRVEGESSFINILSYNNNVKELVCGISKVASSQNNNYNNVVELYNLKDKNYTNFITKDILGNVYSDIFSVIKNPNENYKYIFTYIVQNSTEYYLIYKISYFLFETTNKFITEKDISYKSSNKSSVTCFLTEKLKHICFFESESKELKAMVYNIDFENNGIESIIYTPNNSNNAGGENQFFKGIHLKKEIGFFIYYIQKDSTFPAISLYSCNSDLSMIPYSNFKDIIFEKGTYIKDNVINDIVKLNENQVCFVSTDNSKKFFNIILYSLYNNDKLMNIRHYLLEMWDSHKHKIFSTIKINLYKQFLSIAYSHCPQTDCSSDNHEHHSSLIIFGYPNSTVSFLDVIPELYTNNKNLENDYCFYFENKTYIENNLFGLVVKGVNIINYPKDEIILTNSSNFDVIQNDSIVLKDECITLSFPTHENYEKKNYIIEIAYVLTEPEYNYNNIYLNDTDETLGNKIESEEQYYLHHDYFGKHTQFTLKINNKLTTNCEDYCSLCYFDNKRCIACIYDYDFKDNEKICYPKPTDTILISETNKPTEYIENTKPTEYIETDKHSENIENNDQCIDEYILKDEIISKIKIEQIGEIYSLLKDNINIINLNEDSKKIFKANNTIFQISTLEEQKNINGPNTSSIDLGDCEKILKEKEGLDEEKDLLIFKTDIKSDDLSNTYVQYEIYNPITLELIPLDECKNSSIRISVPIFDERITNIYDSFQKYRYNLYDLSDPFYNDICSTYTTVDGTDLTLSDRKNLFNNIRSIASLCQKGCTFQNYNISTKKAECSCPVQVSETVIDINKLNFDEDKDKDNFKDEFFNTLNYSNFRVLKCYKLVFSKEGQKYNKGSYIMSGISFIFIVLMIIYIFNDHLKINTYIQNILRSKKNSINFMKTNTESLKKEKNNKEIIKKKNININIKNNNKNSNNKNNNNKNKKNNIDKSNKNNKNNKNKGKKNEKEKKNKNKGKKNENKTKINKNEKNMRISTIKKRNKKHNFPRKRKSITIKNRDTSKKKLQNYMYLINI